MTLPTLNENGLLDPGIYDLTLAEIGHLFGQFQRSDARVSLFKRLEELVAELRDFDFADHLIVDGSFTTSKDTPSDIDLIFAVKDGALPIGPAINPYQYNVLSSRRLKKSTSSMLSGPGRVRRL